MTPNTETTVASQSTVQGLDSILFVEDCQDDFVVARHHLKKLNITNPADRVGCIDDMLEYLALRGSQRDTKGSLPTVIIMDLGLRGENGLDGQARLRSNFKYRKIPIIVISSNERIHTLKSAVSLGANGYLLKPFKAEEFMSLAVKLNLKLDFDRI
jgi:CheY-like chemotaxis protein